MEHKVFKKSKAAYVRTVFVLCVGLIIGLSVFTTTSKQWGSIIIAAILICCAYSIMMIRSHLLYTDDNGVWIFSGVFPWAQKCYGVKWRDLDDALYYPHLLGWLCKSYTVRVGHRFTRTNEIVITSVSRGNDAVIHINEMHQYLLSTGTLN